MFYTYDLCNSMHERNTLVYKNISHFILERGPQFVVSWEIDGEIYTQRGDFFPYLLPGARGCQRLHPLASRVVREASDRLRIPGSTPDSLHLCLNLTAWLSRGLLSVTHLFDQTAWRTVISCLLITMWQLVKAHGVTRNEPKIHVIYYITTGWARWSTRSYARNRNFTIQTNGICTTQNPSQRLGRSNSSGILRYKRVT